uniref:Uncharacterized protein n=1 Tax=Meloidogyne javanica TaxID=6303 RepID=A0A915LFS6_MELJA
MIPKQKLESSSADPVKENTKKGRKEEQRIVKANDREFNAQFKYAQRHRNDRIVNQRVAYVLRYNTKRGKIDICEEEWMNVKVGDIVRMESGDFIAADLLLLSTSDSGICYIETAELDGETNLKTRMALPCTTEMGDIIDKIYEFDGEKFFKNLLM